VKNITMVLVSDGLEAYGEEDYKRAFKLFSQACDGGVDDGCERYTELKQRYKDIE
jgi:hypothetical protein